MRSRECTDGHHEKCDGIIYRSDRMGRMEAVEPCRGPCHHTRRISPDQFKNYMKDVLEYEDRKARDVLMEVV